MERKKQSAKTERNQKFIDFYNEISESDEFLSLKTHKRVKYLAEEFKKRSEVDIPIGTIYKLIRNNNTRTISNEVGSTLTSSGESAIEDCKQNEVLPNEVGSTVSSETSDE